MADARGRPPRPKELGRYLQQGALDADRLDWTPSEDDDPVEVALAAVQQRLLAAAVARTGAADAAAALASLLALDRRNAVPLASGERALASEQIVRLLLWLDLASDAIADPAAPGSTGLLPDAYRPWVARGAAPGPVRFVRPRATTDWDAVAHRLAGWRADDPAAHLHDDSQLLAETVRAIAAHGGPAAALAGPTSPSRAARVRYHGRADVEIAVRLLDERATRAAVIAALRPLAELGDHALVSVLAAAPRPMAGLFDLWPALAAARSGQPLTLDLQDLHAIGVSPPGGVSEPVEVTCLARSADTADEVLVLSPTKRVP